MATEKTKNDLVPEHVKGVKTDTVERVDFASEKEAIDFYKVARQRLLNVPGWDGLCGLGSATFALVSDNGAVVNRPAEKGDYLRIELPAPGSKAGAGYDWVSLEAVEEKSEGDGHEQIAMRARPAKNPQDKGGDTSHFFREDASSTFMVIREKNTVKAEIHGRNELPNVRQMRKLDSFRNFIVAIGAMLGFSKFQWTKLVKGIMSLEKDK